MKQITTAAAILCMLTACQTKPPSETLREWRAFELDLVGAFNDIYGDSTMQFKPADFAYPIGSVLRVGSNSLLSSECKLADPTVKIEPIPGPSVPMLTSSRQIKASADLDTYVQKLFNEGTTLNAGIELGPTMSAKLIDPQVYLLAENQSAQILKEPKCLDSLLEQRVTIVRGYVEAKYSISSSKGYKATADATIRENELVKLTFDTKDKFEIEDARPSKKFVILTNGTVVKAPVIETKTAGSLISTRVTCVPAIRTHATTDGLLVEPCDGIGLYQAAAITPEQLRARQAVAEGTTQQPSNCVVNAIGEMSCVL